MDEEPKQQFNTYLDRLRERAKESRVHSRHQMIGLMIADTLGDQKHKALYIKMARDENGEKMLYLAKSIADNSKVVNKGAYFMRVWQLENKTASKKKSVLSQNKKKSKIKKKLVTKKKNGNRNSKKPE